MAYHPSIIRGTKQNNKDNYGNKRISNRRTLFLVFKYDRTGNRPSARNAANFAITSSVVLFGTMTTSGYDLLIYEHNHSFKNITANHLADNEIKNSNIKK